MPSLLNAILYREERELLVNGHIRNQSVQCLLIPEDIIKLCLNFYDDVYYWNIQNEKYKEFMNCEFQQEILGPTFIIQGIEFQLFSYPTGEYPGEEGYVQFYVKLANYPNKEFPSHIYEIHVYFVLYCQQTQHEFRYIFYIGKHTYFD